VLGSSVLECCVYAKRKIGTDRFIGGTKGGIESLLAEGASGGLHLLVSALFANSNPPLAITRELCKQDAGGNQRKTQTILEFTIVAISKESDVTELKMEEAVAQGKNALDRMKPVQSWVEPIQGAVDTSATTVADSQKRQLC
jgi:hypothetical protein